MMLDFVKADRPQYDHWKIPKENHIIRILGDHNAIVSISRAKGSDPHHYQIDVALHEIQKAISNQLDQIFDKLWGSKDPNGIWYNIHMSHYTQQQKAETEKFI